MKPIRTRALLSALAAAALTVGCGGNDAVPSMAQSMVQQIASAQSTGAEGRKKVLALTPATVDVDALFDWAEYKFPELFPAAGRLKFDLSYEGVNYKLRYYTTDNYLGLTDTKEIWGLGPFTSNQLMKIGALSEYASLVVADECKVYPNRSGCGGGSTPPTGPLNECAHPSIDTLPVGFRSHLIYESTGTLTGDWTIDSVIDGPGYAFEGKSLIRISSTISGTNLFEGIPLTTTLIKSFHEITNGVARTVGTLTDISSTTMGVTLPGSSIKVVYQPPRDNWEFRLAQQQTATVSTATQTTSISPPGQTLAGTLVETVTFETKESVTVPAGTFQACRYREAGDSATSYTLIWYILGKGVQAKTQSFSNGLSTGTQVLQTGSTFGGAPL